MTEEIKCLDCRIIYSTAVISVTQTLVISSAQHSIQDCPSQSDAIHDSGLDSGAGSADVITSQPDSGDN